MKQKIIDPYNSERKFKNSRESNLKDLFSEDKDLIKRFLYDMEKGVNVSKSKRGSRSYTRLNSLKCRIPRVAKWIKEKYNKKLTDVNSREIIELFDDVQKGLILKDDKKPYKSVDDYIKDFRSFWNWYIKMMRRENNKIIENIMEDVEDTQNEVGDWVYFLPEYETIKQNAKFEYKVLMDFLLDSGVRTGKELLNIRVSHIEEIPDQPNIANLTIIKESSKTFGRTFKLMRSYPILKKYIQSKNLKDEDQLFKISPVVVNRYLKRLFKRLFSNNSTKGGKKYSQVRLYDFRHNAACYWVPKYKQESILKYRFGWKSSDMIEYYTKFLGHKDTIQEEDLLSDITKTQLEKELDQERQRVNLLEDQLERREKDIEQLLKLKKVMDKIFNDPNKKAILDKL